MRTQIFRQQAQNGLFQALQTPGAFEYGERRIGKDSGTGYSVFLSHRVNNKWIGNYSK